MSPAAARAITYSVVALLAYGAIAFKPESPRPRARKPAAVISVANRPPAWTQRTDTLGSGETLSQLLDRGGVSAGDATAALEAARPLDERRVPAGMAVTLRSPAADSAPSEIVFHLADDRIVRVLREGSEWKGRVERLPWTTDTMVVGGEIRSTLYDALDSAASTLPRGARSELAWTLADIFEYRVDMSRDLQSGDRFRVLVERAAGPDGAVKIGRILAARFELSGSRVDAIRYHSAGARGDYFDGDGKSMRAAFLRAPLAFRRISSVFGFRKHPILGVWRQHKGTDYAAAQGTPVRAVGDGVVVFAGVKHGFGNVIELRHRNGYVSRYGHLRSFAAGTRAGARVGIGKTIAFVGRTGLATAPHLHFEVLVNGVQRDPRVALRMKGGEPIPGGEWSAFESVRAQLLASLAEREGALKVAMRN